MRKALRNIVQAAVAVPASLLSLEQWIDRTGHPLLLPFYHTIYDGVPQPHIEHLYPLRPLHTFEADLDWLLRHFQALDWPGLELHLQGEPLKKPSFFLSFDDGLRQVADVIAPILLKKGVPAAFFLNAAFVDNRDLFFRYKASLLIAHWQQHPPEKVLYRSLSTVLDQYQIPAGNLPGRILAVDYHRKEVLDELAILWGLDFSGFLKNYRPYLSNDQVFDLLKQGFYIGAHSVDHPLYARLSLEEQLRQTRESLDFVQNEFQLPYRLFAFPFTDDGVPANYFKDHRDTLKVNASFGCAGIQHSPFDRHLQRLPMENSPQPAAEWVQNAYAYAWLRSKALGKP